MMPELWQVLAGGAAAVLAWCTYWLVCDVQEDSK